jgi:hypothetical protein
LVNGVNHANFFPHNPRVNCWEEMTWLNTDAIEACNSLEDPRPRINKITGKEKQGRIYFDLQQ